MTSEFPPPVVATDKPEKTAVSPTLPGPRPATDIEFQDYMRGYGAPQKALSEEKHPWLKGVSSQTQTEEKPKTWVRTLQELILSSMNLSRQK